MTVTKASGSVKKASGASPAQGSKAENPAGGKDAGSGGEPSGSRRLVVIDGANAIFRAFFAIPGLKAPDGTPTNAAMGFVNILNRVIQDEEPDLIAVAMDPPGGSFRKEIYEDYKANRDATPEDLSIQFPIVRELLEAHNIRVLEVPGFEADDVIATLVDAVPEDVNVSIISTDKDLMQLCSERVELVDGIKSRRFGPAEVEEKFGVPPEQMLDLRSLVGDPSDNIPGVKGIGVKGAAKLISEWGSLENLLENAEQVKAKRAREGLIEHAEEARLSKELSTLRSDVSLPVEIHELARSEPDAERLHAIYKRLGFTRLMEALEAQGHEALAGASRESEEAGSSATIAIVADSASLKRLIPRLGEASELVLLLISERASVIDATITGLAIGCEGGDSYYLPVAPSVAEVAELPLLEADGAARSPQPALPLDELVAGLGTLLQGKNAKPWYGWGVKRIQAQLWEAGLEVELPSFDLEIAAFLLDPAGSHDLPALAMQILGRTIPSWEDLAGRGAKAKRPEELASEDLAGWAGAWLGTMEALRAGILERLGADGLLPLYQEVELPLTRVLARVERNGVRVDEDELANLSAEYEKDLERIEKDIFSLAGEKFLVSSPKQLQTILFEKLNLTPLKKTKTGYSTAESVLEQLASQHELPGRILAWRQLSKLKSTYLDALPKLVSAKTGRIHPSFNQIGAATGRLSASDPNVQNIPIRTEAGARIREAFIPAEGLEMLSADYSQVELRILAHYSEDESLLDAFSKGEDIHRRTAAEIAGIEVGEVTSDQRDRAKAVNFGIIYGSSAFGLANNLGIATAEAQEIVDAYFERYAGVRRFLDATVRDAKQCGYVSTFLGRRRYLPDLASRNRVLRQAAERMAVNTVIQGTAADLIKKAMVDVDEALVSSDLHVIMIMQVHDELVFELPADEVESLSALLRLHMEGALSLRVPLVIDTGVGHNWREAH